MEELGALKRVFDILSDLKRDVQETTEFTQRLIERHGRPGQLVNAQTGGTTEMNEGATDLEESEAMPDAIEEEIAEDVEYPEKPGEMLEVVEEAADLGEFFLELPLNTPVHTEMEPQNEAISDKEDTSEEEATDQDEPSFGLHLNRLVRPELEQSDTQTYNLEDAIKAKARNIVDYILNLSLNTVADTEMEQQNESPSDMEDSVKDMNKGNDTKTDLDPTEAEMAKHNEVMSHLKVHQIAEEFTDESENCEDEDASVETLGKSKPQNDGQQADGYDVCEELHVETVQGAAEPSTSEFGFSSINGSAQYLAMNCSSHGILRNYSKHNHQTIKIRRSIESLWMLVKNSIKKAEQDKNFEHIIEDAKQRPYICTHSDVTPH